jgi:hypothetical protein
MPLILPVSLDRPPAQVQVKAASEAAAQARQQEELALARLL